MVSKGSDSVVLYPAYFDARRSHMEGRRVPRSLAVENPTIDAIAQAAKAMGYRTFTDREASYSSTPWRRDGRVLVTTDEAKSALVRKIALKMKKT